MAKTASTFKNTLIFCDGASTGNPGPGGWGAIICTPEGNVRELGGKEAHTTNNRMELEGAIGALVELRSTTGDIDVYTDSVYVIRGITQWCWGWMKKNWKTAEGNPVANDDLWKRLISLVSARRPGKMSWNFVRGHVGIPGNERVDQIATSMAQGKWIDLYRGPLLQYPVAIHDIPEDTSLPEMKPRNDKKVAAYSYLSVLGNTVMRHSTWADCERRVKGQSGAKFKKAMNAEDEAKILTEWGFRATDVKQE